MSVNLLEEAGASIINFCEISSVTTEDEVKFLVGFIDQLLSTDVLHYHIFALAFTIQLANSLQSVEQHLPHVIPLFAKMVQYFKLLFNLLSSNQFSKVLRKIALYLSLVHFSQLLIFAMKYPNNFVFLEQFITSPDGVNFIDTLANHRIQGYFVVQNEKIQLY